MKRSKPCLPRKMKKAMVTLLISNDGEVDEDGDFCIFVPGKYHGIGMPFGRLMGWAYKK